MMYVVDPAAEEGHDAVKQKIEGIITGREGTISLFEKLGKKRLAYPIKKRQYGIYYLVNMSGDSRIVQALESFLLLNPIVLRHIVLAFTDKELSLRSETHRIQLEEDERMRMGGRPLGASAEDENGDTVAVDTALPVVEDSKKDVSDSDTTKEASEEIEPVVESGDELADEKKAETSDETTPSEETQEPVEETVKEVEESTETDNSDEDAEKAEPEVDDNESKD